MTTERQRVVLVLLSFVYRCRLFQNSRHCMCVLR